MESLLPSEVARLVYGYLIDQDCSDAAGKFLETSPHLKECLSESKKGKKFQTKIDGKNLEQILDKLSQAKEQAQFLAEDFPKNLTNFKLLSLLNLFSVNITYNVDNKNKNAKTNGLGSEICIEDISCSEQTDDASPSDTVHEPSAIVCEKGKVVEEKNKCNNSPDETRSGLVSDDEIEFLDISGSVELSPPSVVEWDENEITSVTDKQTGDDDTTVSITHALNEPSTDDKITNESDDDIKCISTVIDLDNDDLLIRSSPLNSSDSTPSTSSEPSNSMDRRRRNRKRKSNSPHSNLGFGLNLPVRQFIVNSISNRSRRSNLQVTPPRLSQRPPVNPIFKLQKISPDLTSQPHPSFRRVPFLVNSRVCQTSAFASPLNRAVVTNVAETLAFMAYDGVNH